MSLSNAMFNQALVDSNNNWRQCGSIPSFSAQRPNGIDEYGGPSNDYGFGVRRIDE